MRCLVTSLNLGQQTSYNYETSLTNLHFSSNLLSYFPILFGLSSEAEDFLSAFRPSSTGDFFFFDFHAPTSTKQQNRMFLR